MFRTLHAYIAKGKIHGLGREWVTSFGHQFDFHDVIGHVQPCNVDNRRGNVVCTNNGHSKRTYK